MYRMCGFVPLIVFLEGRQRRTKDARCLAGALQSWDEIKGGNQGCTYLVLSISPDPPWKAMESIPSLARVVERPSTHLAEWWLPARISRLANGAKKGLFGWSATPPALIH
jgi:hypothetical protein